MKMKTRTWLFKTLFREEFDLYKKLFLDSLRISDLLESYKSKLEEKEEISAREKELMELEVELNSKYPKKVITYTGRYIPNHGSLKIDVRGFLINPVCKEIQFAKVWSDLPDDEAALNCLKWVIDNITYVSDPKNFGIPEFWSLPQETLSLRCGDCDSGSILLSNLMEVAGIPYFKIRLVASDTVAGGHCWVSYYSESDASWKSMDWCFFPNKKLVKDRKDYKKDKNYGDVWFSFNRNFAFAKNI